jgi:hypothetical protein
MIGAGSYAERESLMTWAARSGVPGAGECTRMHVFDYYSKLEM